MRAALVGAIAIGVPFAAVGTANAAPDSAWDRLAQCESGGNWKTNTGNGYSGGLQFSPSTWRAFGGSGSPHGASRSQQIAVAERVLASQGWNAWPSCSRKAGVRAHSASTSKAKKATAAKSSSKSSSKSGSKSGSKSSSKSGSKSSSRSGGKATVKPVALAKAGSDYTVARGDTLGSIANRNGVPGGWKAVFDRNADVLSSPHHLRVGQQLDLR